MTLYKQNNFLFFVGIIIDQQRQVQIQFVIQIVKKNNDKFEVIHEDEFITQKENSHILDVKLISQQDIMYLKRVLSSRPSSLQSMNPSTAPIRRQKTLPKSFIIIFFIVPLGITRICSPVVSRIPSQLDSRHIWSPMVSGLPRIWTSVLLRLPV